MEQRKKTILIADDDMDCIIQMETILKNMGFHVVSCESQSEAEEKIRGMKPDLAIFDLMMENEDSGFILSYKLKSRYPDVPVIIATAVASETGIGFSLSSEVDQQWIKADAYLEKGIHPDQLRAEIHKLLSI